MEELLLSPFDLALIIDDLKLPILEATQLIQTVWQSDTLFLPLEYREDGKKWMLKVLYWLDYRYDKKTLDAEFPTIQQDCGGNLKETEWKQDHFQVDLMKSMHIKILYVSKQHCVRMKLGTLLGAYGGKRRSPALMESIEKRLYFYHIQPMLRSTVCNMMQVRLKDMITFRVV